MLISGGDFENNSGGSGGAVVLHVENQSVTVVNGTVFSQNEADNDGGALLSQALSLSIRSATFQGNKVGYFGRGGGLSLRRSSVFGTAAVNIRDSEFRSNSAEVQGGGVDCNALVDTGSAVGPVDLNIVGSAVVNNIALDPVGTFEGKGGGLGVTECSVSVLSTNFDHNCADAGAGIYFRGSQFGMSESALYMNGTDEDPSKCSVLASEGGGMAALWDGVGTFEITGTTFDGNHGDSGGGLRVSGPGGTAAQAYVDSSTFDSNTALDGGGVDLVDVTAVLAGANVLIANSADGNGGAIRAGCTGGELVVGQGVTLDTNSAARGGGLYSAGCSVGLLGSLVVGNDASGSGGGFYVEGAQGLPWDPATASQLQFEDVTFRWNTAGDNGGAVYGQEISMSHEGGGYDANFLTGAGFGGGLFLEVPSAIVLDQVALHANSAGAGTAGAAYLKVSDATMANVLVVENQQSSGTALQLLSPPVSVSAAPLFDLRWMTVAGNHGSTTCGSAPDCPNGLSITEVPTGVQATGTLQRSVLAMNEGTVQFVHPSTMTTQNNVLYAHDDPSAGLGDLVLPPASTSSSPGTVAANPEFEGGFDSSQPGYVSSVSNVEPWSALYSSTHYWYAGATGGPLGTSLGAFGSLGGGWCSTSVEYEATCLP